jgi:DNA sulfur modification protein DndD
MDVSKVTIRNFMPFYKSVEVNLQTDPDASLILIGGKNDRGKTAFFQALRFCLYGFEGTNVEVAQQRRRAINRRAATEGLGETSVQIEFTHNDAVYKIKRLIEFDEVDDPDDRRVNDCYVRVTKPSGSGEEDIVSRSDPNRKYNEFMNGILPESAADFFFFDGEELNRYAGSYETADNDVKEAIETVLGIKEIQNTIEDLEVWGEKYYREKWQETTDDVDELEDVADEIAGIEADLEANRTEKDSKERELEDLRTRLRQLKDEIADAKGVSEARERIKEIEDELGGDPDDDSDDGLRGELQAKREEQRELHTRLGPLMVGVGAQTMVDSYEVSLVGGLEDVIQYLLDADTCVCGNDITDEEKTQLERNLAEVQDDEMTTVLDLQEMADTHLDCLVDGVGPPDDLGVREAKREYVSLQGEIEQLETDIESLEAEKEEKQDIVDEAQVTEEEQEAMEEERDDLQREIGRLEGSIEDLGDEIDRLENEKEELESQVDRLDTANDEEARYRALMRLSSKCRDAWQNIKEEYVQDQRESVQTHASEIFRELTNKDEVYKGLTINEEYELDVQTVSGQRDIEEQNPSKGARQIIAYSFIAGLNQFTAREAPVVIDTPIGRLDPEHKDNLIRHFPDFQDQVVILYQPGELRERDIEKMKPDVAQHLQIHQREDDPEASDITEIDSQVELREVLAD